MIIHILRTVLVGAVIYYLTKVIRNAIDARLDQQDSLDTSEEGMRQEVDVKLIPCPKCAVYYSKDQGHDCEQT